MSDPAAQPAHAQIALSPRQGEHLLGVLRELADVLRDLQRPDAIRSVAGTSPRGDADDLPPAFGRRAAPHLASLAFHLTALSTRLADGPAPTSRRNALQEKLHQCLFDVLDSDSHALRGYGPVDSATAAEIDRELMSLRVPLEELLAILGAGPWVNPGYPAVSPEPAPGIGAGNGRRIEGPTRLHGRQKPRKQR